MTPDRSPIRDPRQQSLFEVDDLSLLEDDRVPSTVKYTVSSYGADYPVDGLVKRLRLGDIAIPEFQRGFVWTHAQASRFIESLLLGLPVPGIFLSRDPSSNRLLVVDGQQRLRSLRSFYDGVLNDSPFVLRGVSTELEGLTYETLSDEDRRRLDDSIIHATIIKQEDPQGDETSIYLVFERLNTGGTPLTHQEIRASVFGGPFKDLIRGLNQIEDWRQIAGPPSDRMKDEELILRFLALYYALDRYERPMHLFLTRFMQLNQNLEHWSQEEIGQLFSSTCRLAVQLPKEAFRPERSLNAAYLDAMLVALARRITRGGEVENLDKLKEQAFSLVVDPEFVAKTKSGTTDEANVRGRIELATKVFAEVK